MAYKTLGQTSATAASPATITNLIKTPVFDNMAKSWGAGMQGQYNWQLIPGTCWYWGSNYGSLAYMGVGSSRSTYGNMPDYILLSGHSAYGTDSLCCGEAVGGNNGNQAIWFATGLNLRISSSTGYSASDTNFTNGFAGAANAIPVQPSTTYYMGVDYFQKDSQGGSMYVAWFDSTGAYISNYNFNITASSTSWNRNNSSTTSPSNAAYAGVYIQAICDLRNVFGVTTRLDGIYFGTDSSYATAFKSPLTGTNNLLTAPFTGRYSTAYVGEIGNSYSGTTYAGAPTLLYTVPSTKSTVVSTLTVTNASSSNTQFRVAVVPSGQTLAAKHFIVFDTPIASYATTTLTLGLTLADGDKIYVASDLGTTQFSAFGNEA